LKMLNLILIKKNSKQRKKQHPKTK
jgi:hypothetical protein